jgi:hypothetical protein
VDPLSYSDRTMTVTDALHVVDAFFLRALFRPTHGRGVPPAARVRRVLHKFLPGYPREPTDNHGATTTTSTSTSIQLQVLLMMYEWKAQQERVFLHMTPVKIATPRRAAATPGTALAQAPTDLSIYDSFQMDVTEDVEINTIEDDSFLLDTGAADDELDQVDRDKDAAVQAHEARWRQLFLDLEDESEIDRWPAAMGLSNNGASHGCGLAGPHFDEICERLARKGGTTIVCW